MFRDQQDWGAVNAFLKSEDFSHLRLKFQSNIKGHSGIDRAPASAICAVSLNVCVAYVSEPASSRARTWLFRRETPHRLWPDALDSDGVGE
jgi:hypothetical protein